MGRAYDRFFGEKNKANTLKLLNELDIIAKSLDITMA